MNIKELLAQAYCTPRNKHKELDATLIIDMEKIILKAIKSLPRYYYSNCEGIKKNKRIGKFVMIDDLLQ